MNILLQKGAVYNAVFTSAEYPALTPDWVGDVSLYISFPGTPVFTKSLGNNGVAMTLYLTIAEILNITSGTYTFVTTISNAVLQASSQSVNYASVLDQYISATSMCKLFGTVEKINGTPTGAPTSVLVNSSAGAVLQAGWKGTEISVVAPATITDGDKIVSIERITTTTNAAGYFELYVIKGSTVTVTCTSFDKSVTVDTTGLDTIDLSTYF